LIKVHGGTSQFLTDAGASAKVKKITRIKFLFMCDFCDFRDLCDLCDIYAFMDIMFASGWITPAGAHAPACRFGPRAQIPDSKSGPVRRTSRLAGDAIIILPIYFHFGPAYKTSQGRA
jgi:hypothetical protein